MNALPPELRTPPLPVVALVGCAELHKELGAYFNANLRPPLFSVGLAEANESLLGRLFGASGVGCGEEEGGGGGLKSCERRDVMQRWLPCTHATHTQPPTGSVRQAIKPFSTPDGILKVRRCCGASVCWVCVCLCALPHSPAAAAGARVVICSNTTHTCHRCCRPTGSSSSVSAARQSQSRLCPGAGGGPGVGCCSRRVHRLVHRV
jgi:hypothetical protein